MPDHKILIVDDNADTRILESRILEKEQYTVLNASDGAEALQILDIHPDVALILTDINMPGMDGFTFLEKLIPFRESNPALRVALVSGRKAKDDVVRGLKLRADDYILKPIDPAVLRDKVKTLLGISSNRSDFVWLDQHMLAYLRENVIALPFTVTQISETRLVLEASVRFVEGANFSFSCDKLSSGMEYLEGEFLARVDTCEVVSNVASRYRVMATFVGMNDVVQQKLRKFTMKRAKK